MFQAAPGLFVIVALIVQFCLAQEWSFNNTVKFMAVGGVHDGKYIGNENVDSFDTITYTTDLTEALWLVEPCKVDEAGWGFFLKKHNYGVVNEDFLCHTLESQFWQVKCWTWDDPELNPDIWVDQYRFLLIPVSFTNRTFLIKNKGCDGYLRLNNVDRLKCGNKNNAQCMCL